MDLGEDLESRTIIPALDLASSSHIIMILAVCTSSQESGHNVRADLVGAGGHRLAGESFAASQ
jgi:hypothetical protein